MRNYFYKHNVDDFLPLIEPFHEKNQHTFEIFKNDIIENKHPILSITQDLNLFQEIDSYKKLFKHDFKTLIILGTGGSSLGARAIASWFGFHNNPILNQCDFNFFATDNLDDLSFSIMLKNINFDNTHFLIISKSGNTVETNVQLQVILKLLINHNKVDLIPKIMTIITEVTPEKNNLVQISERYNIPVLKHSLTIGGRYSVLSMTGLLPASLMGFDYNAILKGAQSVIDYLLNAKTISETEPCIGAAGLIAAERNGLVTHIFATYGDRFTELSLWTRQLWAESLGKNEKGSLFVPSINPLDQHSQLQMYYDGIDNKIYSFIECELEDNIKTQLSFEKESSFSYLNGKTIHDVVHASCSGTIASLRSRGRLIRTFSIKAYTAETLGALMMHFMVETIFASYLLEVDPYNQPAVEDYKKRTKDLLKS